MADRYRDRPFPADDDHGRGQSPQQQGESDPLAELARLIGQTDPFSSFGRDYPSQSASRQSAAVPEHSEYSDDGGVPVSPPAWVQNRRAAQYAEPEPRYEEPANYPQDAASRYDEALYGAPLRNTAPAGRQDDVYDYNDAAYDSEAAYDESYDETAPEPSAKPRRSLIIIGVVALAVLGTAGAYGYRSLSGSGRGGEPPVIKADNGPSKVAPPSQSSEGKLIYDRVNADKATEQVVSREEQPIDVNTNRSGPRIVFPPLTQNANPPSAAAPPSVDRSTPAPVAGNGTLGGDEPRRIRTLSIRPDQADSAVAPVNTPSPPPAKSAATQRAAPTTAAPATPRSSANANANSPVSLAPHASPAESRSRTASISPTTPAASGGGAYIQVSSQKTEADAQASFRALQSKYPGILGSRSASIRRADLGEKGVFYRAMVGPFGSTEDATQFCINLKAAGGQCVVQRN